MQNTQRPTTELGWGCTVNTSHQKGTLLICNCSARTFWLVRLFDPLKKNERKRLGSSIRFHHEILSSVSKGGRPTSQLNYFVLFSGTRKSLPKWLESKISFSPQLTDWSSSEMSPISSVIIPETKSLIYKVIRFVLLWLGELWVRIDGGGRSNLSIFLFS